MVKKRPARKIRLWREADISYSVRLMMLQAAASAEKEAAEALTQPNAR
jgi:hypothetical protein